MAPIASMSQPEAQSHNKPPDQFAGRYKILQSIGEGGVGVVYQAYDQNLKRTVAIKTLRFSGDNRKRVLRFQREAKAASKLKHPGLVEVFDFGITDDGTPFLSMEFIEGTALSKFLQQRGRVPCLEALQITFLIARAMDHAHANRVIHRDLKPSNILMIEEAGGDMRIKIVDFGLAAVLEEDSPAKTLTPTHAISGSPNYMSPEQIRLERVDERTDIYSLGCIFYELISGKPPFDSQTTLEILERQVTTAPLPLQQSTEPGLVPDSVQHLADKMLAKQPGERFESMKALKEAIMHNIVELKSSAERKTAFENSLSDTGALAILPLPLDQKGDSSERRLKILPLAITVCGAFAILIALLLLTAKSHQSKAKDEDLTAQAVQKAPTDIERDEGALDALSQSHFEGSLGRSKKIFSDDPSYDDEDLDKSLRRSKEFTEIELESSSISDEALKRMHELPSLISLDIAGAQNITDRGASYLTGLHLRQLSLAGTKITDAAIADLSKIKTLTDLRLDNTNVSSQGVKVLAALPELDLLSLSNTKVRGKEFLVLTNLKHLRCLKLAKTKVTDEDMQYISQIKSLHQLWLTDSQISDKGLRYLLNLPGLKSLRFTRVSGFKPQTIELIKQKTGCTVDEGSL